MTRIRESVRAVNRIQREVIGDGAWVELETDSVVCLEPVARMTVDEDGDALLGDGGEVAVGVLGERDGGVVHRCAW